MSYFSKSYSRRQKLGFQKKKKGKERAGLTGSAVSGCCWYLLDSKFFSARFAQCVSDPECHLLALTLFSPAPVSVIVSKFVFIIASWK